MFWPLLSDSLYDNLWLMLSTIPRTRLILARHGETLANREFRYIGIIDHLLSEHGRLQAGQLAEALSMLPITAVYSSPLQRAFCTAESIAAKHALAVQILSGLIEGSFGSWEGMSRAEVLVHSPQDEQQLLAWERDPNVAPPDGESFAMIYERALTTVEQLAQAHIGQTIVLVSHVGVIKALLCAALGTPLTSASHIFLDPATISVVDWHPLYPLLRLLNSHAHLGWEQACWMHS
jgi:broad specificity phosphatase PhoE